MHTYICKNKQICIYIYIYVINELGPRVGQLVGAAEVNNVIPLPKLYSNL